MESEDDPFDSVYSEVLAAWATVESSFDRWQAVWAARDMGATEANGSAIESRLRDIEWDLQDLDEAVRIAKSNPASFGLNLHQVAARQRSVDALRDNLGRVRATISSPDVSRCVQEAKRTALLPPGSAGTAQAARLTASSGRASAGKRAKAGAIAVDDIEQQELIVREQDENLDDLAVAVQRIGAMGKEMHEELQQHSVLLDDMEVDMDSTSSRMRTVHQKLDEFMSETSRGQLCTIVCLFFLFILLTFLVIAT